MPLYTYQCEHCHDVMEFRTLSATRPLPPDAVCPRCHAGPLVKLPSAPAFVVKGYSAKNGYSKAGQ